MTIQESDLRKSYRVQFRFWLDVTRDEEYELAGYAEDLKKERGFASTIRDALRLIRDLRQGRVDVLLRLFPWIEDYFAKPTSEPILSLHDPLREQLERLAETLLKRDVTPPVSDILMDLPSRKQLSASVADMNFDLEIKEARSSADNNPSWNLMISSALNVFGSCEGLPSHVIEYGVRTGRIVQAQLPEKKSETGGPKAMDVPQFTPPEIGTDDLEALL